MREIAPWRRKKYRPYKVTDATIARYLRICICWAKTFIVMIGEHTHERKWVNYEIRQGLKVACLEGIAYRNGWISEERMREIAKPMLKNQYGQYMLKVIDEMKEETNSNFFRHKGLEKQELE